MPQPELGTLEGEVRELARRLERIERELGIAGRVETPAAAVGVEATALPPRVAPIETTALLPVLGRALLGLAGAFLLRALTESGTLPHGGGIAIGVLYGLAWLVWAARTPAAQRLEAAIHALTAALVLAPLVWEGVLRFHAISTWTAGGLLLFFTAFGMAVSWRKNLLMVASIATLTGLATSAALIMATHDVLPFAAVLLAIAAAVEVSACLDHWLSERWLAALAADLAVLLATWLVTNERGLPPAYAPIPHAWLLGAQMALLGIYLSSTIFRTLVRGATFTAFEIAQSAAAFLISVSGGLSLASADPRLEPAMAALMLGCAAACYVVSFARLERGGRGRNFYTYSTFGILLATVATRILLSGTGANILWPLLAVACIWAGGRFGRLTLEVHGGIYLLLSVLSSGALVQAGAFVAGSATWPGPRDAALVVGTLAAGICYLLAVRRSARGNEWNFQVFRVALAAVFAWLAAGTIAGALTAAYHGIFGQLATHAYCATLRTGVVAISALVLAWAGSRWNVAEFLRLIYPAMILGAYRLVSQDLRQDRTTALFLSLLLYGAALMALPRLKRGRTAAA